jgi:hypothetical protein
MESKEAVDIDQLITEPSAVAPDAVFFPGRLSLKAGGSENRS